MCLRIVYRGTDKKKFLSKLPRMITAWKIFKSHLREDKYVGLYYNFVFRTGLNKTKYLARDYRIGFHSFLHRKDALGFKYEPDGLIYIKRIKIPKKSIVACGIQCEAEVIVSTKIIVPKFRK